MIRLGMRHMRQTTAGGAYEGSPHAGSPFTGALGFGGFSGTIFGDAFRGGMDEKIFKSIFGDQVAVHQNVPVFTVELTLQEAVEGCTKQVSFSMPLPCPACNWSGFPPGARPQTCTTCGGIRR
jgi:molecular chaperone DnaJ